MKEAMFGLTLGQLSGLIDARIERMDRQEKKAKQPPEESVGSIRDLKMWFKRFS